ncbi:MAG: M28 family peptidase [Bacteroidia bacterium]|nr:M28 family peptidase [Bacteroidia bacterium]NNF81542.1 M28 family peptidase [Flavobacteriaceae bacterium]
MFPLKLSWILAVFLFVGTCAIPSHREKLENIKNGVALVDPNEVVKYSQTITSDELQSHVYLLASDQFEGRAAGSRGHKLAAEFLKRYYIKEGIPSPEGEDYFQQIPSSYFGKDKSASENVYAFIEGDEKPEEVLVVSAHLDHEGIDDNGEIYNGADDDASGTAALMEMAQAFKKAKAEGNGPDRSILFLHTTAEETGLQGSRFYVENPLFPLSKTIANLNIDMIGRVDFIHEREGVEDYLYIIGSDRLSHELHYINEAINATYSKLELDYKYNSEDDHNRYYYRSDHYNFAKNNIPVIFYFNGEHADYHRVSDTPDKINYPLLEKRTRYIFATAWQLANQDKRVALDKTQ